MRFHHVTNLSSLLCLNMRCFCQSEFVHICGLCWWRGLILFATAQRSYCTALFVVCEFQWTTLKYVQALSTRLYVHWHTVMYTHIQYNVIDLNMWYTCTPIHNQSARSNEAVWCALVICHLVMPVWLGRSHYNSAPMWMCAWFYSFIYRSCCLQLCRYASVVLVCDEETYVVLSCHWYVSCASMQK